MHQLLDTKVPDISLHTAHTNTETSSQHKLRVVHLVSSMQVGGMEQMVVRLATAQRRLGHDARVIALNGGPLVQTAWEQGLTIQVLGGRHKLPRVIRGILALAQMRPDIVHAHNPTSLHYAVLGKLLGRPRIVMTDHGGNNGSSTSKKRVATLREQRLTDAVVAVSKDTAAKTSVRGQTIPLTVIYNGIDLAPANTNRIRMRADLGLKRTFVGAIIARLEKIKRHEDLLQAIALLRNTTSPVTMLIIGDGSEKNHLVETAHRLDLGPDRVRFLGFRTDVMDLLAASDFFVLCSQMEGLPLAVIEAMKQRLPVIATAVGGMTEIISHNRNGLLTPVNDPPALAQAISRIAQDPELCARLGQGGYDRVCEEFDIKKMIGRYLELYYRLRAA